MHSVQRTQYQQQMQLAAAALGAEEAVESARRLQRPQQAAAPQGAEEKAVRSVQPRQLPATALGAEEAVESGGCRIQLAAAALGAEEPVARLGLVRETLARRPHPPSGARAIY